MSHTSGKLKHWPGRGRPLITTDDGLIGVARCITGQAERVDMTHPLPNEAEANARRLVAAWNFIDGAPTELVEGRTLGADALLAALKKMVTVFGPYSECRGDDAALNQARTAIAEAEGRS